MTTFIPYIYPYTEKVNIRIKLKFRWIKLLLSILDDYLQEMSKEIEVAPPEI